jgi:hypothetical protein
MDSKISTQDRLVNLLPLVGILSIAIVGMLIYLKVF